MAAGSDVAGMTRGWCDVDQSERPERFLAYLDHASGVDAIAAGKRARADLLGLHAGSRVIDVGCGLGDDARALGPLVAPGGEVVGLDASAVLLNRARARLHADDGPVRFLAGDAHKLPFETGMFDAARTERALQHLADPATAVSELVRVTRRDGIVLACEPDWGTTALSGGPAPLVRAALSAVEQQIRNAWIGRDLAGLFIDAGLTDVTVRADAIVMSDYATVLALTDLPELAERMQDDGHEGADNLVARVHRDADDGRLVLAITLFTAIGRVA